MRPMPIIERWLGEAWPRVAVPVVKESLTTDLRLSGAATVKQSLTVEVDHPGQPIAEDSSVVAPDPRLSRVLPA